MVESPVRTYCTFSLGNGLFGIEASLVKEVAVLPSMTPIPQSPTAVRGYVNLRGQIVLALDLQSLLLQRPTPIGDDTRLVVFRPCLGDPFGILVDRVGDIVALHDERIETCMAGSLANGGEKQAPPEEELVTGIGKCDGELLSILDARKLLPIVDRAIAQCRAAPLHRD